MARSRANRKTERPRPECCEIAGRAGGRKQCEQHKAWDAEGRWHNVGNGARIADYAGAEYPRAKRRNVPELPELPEPDEAGWDVYEIAQAWDMSAGLPPAGTWHAEGTVSLWQEPIMQRYSRGTLAGSPIRVMGGSDPLAADRWMREHGYSWDVEAVEVEDLAEVKAVEVEAA
jgi:hypothetical protein